MHQKLLPHIYLWFSRVLPISRQSCPRRLNLCCSYTNMVSKYPFSESPSVETPRLPFSRDDASRASHNNHNSHCALLLCLTFFTIHNCSSPTPIFESKDVILKVLSPQLTTPTTGQHQLQRSFLPLRQARHRARPPRLTRRPAPRLRPESHARRDCRPREWRWWRRLYVKEPLYSRPSLRVQLPKITR